MRAKYYFVKIHLAETGSIYAFWFTSCCMCCKVTWRCMGGAIWSWGTIGGKGQGTEREGAIIIFLCGPNIDFSQLCALKRMYRGPRAEPLVRWSGGKAPIKLKNF